MRIERIGSWYEIVVDLSCPFWIRKAAKKVRHALGFKENTKTLHPALTFEELAGVTEAYFNRPVIDSYFKSPAGVDYLEKNEKRSHAAGRMR